MENLKDKIVQLLLDSSQQYGDTYEQRCIYDSDFNEVAKCVVNIVMKTPSDALLTEIMVLREKNAEMVEMLKKCNEVIKILDSANSDILNAVSQSSKCPDNRIFVAFNSEIESLINSNITE